MSWVKKRTAANPAPPPVQMYNPNQHSNQDNQWQQQTQQAQNNWYGQNFQQQPPQAAQVDDKQQYQQNYWQQPQPQPQAYANQQQPYAPPQDYQYQNQTAFYPQQQQQQQQQSYANLQYNQQQYNQNNLYASTTDPQSESDGWGSNWGWGDEDNSNNLKQPPPNNIVESFANDESWNWSLSGEDKKSGSDTTSEQLQPHHLKSLPSIDRLTGKRGKLETPQWSVESQVSQESSDDVLATSESEKSRMLSRSSTISHSPISSGHDQLAPPNNHQDDANLVQFENKEILLNAKQDVSPPPAVNTQTPPLLPPPMGDEAKSNPYQRNTTSSHKMSNRYRSSANSTPPQQWQMLSSNLETLPDNSEQPDLAPSEDKFNRGPNTFRRPDNNEAPINDRNQYLETGQLSDVTGGDNTQEDTLPPPGLRRLVLGQMEQQETTTNSSAFASFNVEPPAGLSRMVLGQMEASPPPLLHPSADLPEGFKRLIPGESSSPENVQQKMQKHLDVVDDDDSEAELNEIGTAGKHVVQERSATIGADTPPTTIIPPNRSETIGAASTSPSPPQKHKLKKTRRESIEGNLVGSVRNLNIDDGDKLETEGGAIVGRRHSRQEIKQDGSSDEDDSEIDDGRLRKVGSSPSPTLQKQQMDRRRYKDEGGRSRRYSPEMYRDNKKYNDKRRYNKEGRRYNDDESDYYSDKERGGERRHGGSGRHHDYPRDDYNERKYSSLRKEKERKKRDRKSDYYYEGSSRRYDDSFENESRSRASSRSDSLHHHDAYGRAGERGGAEARRGGDGGGTSSRRHNRDKDRHGRRHREHRGDPFSSYGQGFGYDMYSQYYQQYQYYENLRKTNPQAYAQWYRKYYQDAMAGGGAGGGGVAMGANGMPSTMFPGVEDRASVHSGRSSANDELAKDRYTRQSYYSQTSLPHIGSYYRGSQTHSLSGQYGLDESSFGRPYDQTDNSLNFEDTTTVASQRLTPAKFATAHIKASISSGKLIKVLPHYPMDGQPPSVELCNLEEFLQNDEDYQELKRFPGPLVKGTTHKKTILEYCERKIKMAAYNLDVVDQQDSYILMWELLMLLIKQNGMVVGADIAELLLKNRQDGLVQNNVRPASIASSVNSNNNGDSPSEPNLAIAAVPTTNSTSINAAVLKEDEITNKFRDYLLYGSCKEALEWAMKHGLWGHALFLASKLDKRTYGNVLMRFANGLTMNDPLQTLYQLLSGKIPAAVTCVADEKWGDWRPHLAMILSNTTQRPELNCKAITILGDTLMNRGNLYAAQFCYLMAEVGFGSFNNSEAKLVLLGANHLQSYQHTGKKLNLVEFATTDAIHMTEIYEYACSLNNDAFSLPDFQLYKYLLSTRLADVGLLERSLAYLEKIAQFIVKYPGTVGANVVNSVVMMGDRLKYYDPVGDADDDASNVDLNVSRPDNSWLKELRLVLNDYNIGVYGNKIVEPTPVYSDQQDVWQNYPQQQNSQWQAQDQVPMVDAAQVDYQQQQTQVEQQQPESFQAEQQQQFWQPQQAQQQQWNDYQQNSYQGNFAQPNEHPDEVVKNKNPSDDYQQQQQPMPQISLPNQPQEKDEINQQRAAMTKADATKTKSEPNTLQQQDKSSGTGGWFGFFGKLSLKPKNQMKLPDDKNPSIVWDPDKKRWINTEADAADGVNDFKPPPKMSDLAPKMPTPPSGITQPTYNVPNNNNINQQQPFATPHHQQQGMEPNGNIVKATPNQANMFKLQRGRNLKKSYVDVFNPNGKSSGPSSLPDSGPPSIPPQMNFFIPQPVNDPNAPTDFLTPAPAMQPYDEHAQQMQTQ